jgi:putative methyltransferase (TIGR04325 family)
LKGRQLLKQVIPPIVKDWRLRLLGRAVRYHGRPVDWRQAKGMSGGYADESILARVADAERAVVSGSARYERDSVLFQDTVYPFAVLAALLRAASLNGNRLEVVDFGGSLGSTYRQCRSFLDSVSSIDWWVVEQPEFVALGQREFTNAELRFVRDFGDLPHLSAGGIVLACSVLQYMENPSLTLADIDKLQARHLVIDRTPISEETIDRLCIQHVPKSIYRASYPCWILSRSRLLSRISNSWRVVSDYACVEGKARSDDGLEFEYRGLILERSA